MTPPDQPHESASVEQPLGEPPDLPGYHVEHSERIPIRRVSLLAIVTIPPWGLLFAFAGLLVTGFGDATFHITLRTVVIMLVIVLVLMPVLHEAIHGIAAWVLGARPFFGVGEGYAYTSFHEPVSRNGYLVIIVAPLIVISLGSVAAVALLPGILWYGVAFGAVNAAGSTGDLWMLGKVLRLPASARIVDLADGFAAYRPDQRTQPA
jgi:hypothetical protein